MVGAIRKARDRLAPAKEKLWTSRIANRPTAGLLSQLKQSAPLAERNDVVGQIWVRLMLRLIELRERGISTH